jgi:nucleoside-diphosphate-sugar epimerase
LQPPSAVLDALAVLTTPQRRRGAGDPKLYAVLASVHARFGCVPLAHVQDACDAHVLLMEAPRAEGRYLCAAGGYSAAHLARLLASRYPPFRPGDRHEWFSFFSYSIIRCVF